MPKVFIIPSPLTDLENSDASLWSSVARQVRDVRIFLVEEEKSARRFLKKILPEIPFKECAFYPLNEHTRSEAVKEYFKEAQGKDIGILSECGCPCVADPGAQAVFEAHKRGWEVIPLVGPSSILLALMASGLNGQKFAFEGYLPKDKGERLKRLKFLEKLSAKENQTQIFMETPYHAQKLFEESIQCAEAKTLLAVAADLTGAAQHIKTMTIAQWRAARKPDLHKRNVLFLMLAPG